MTETKKLSSKRIFIMNLTRYYPVLVGFCFCFMGVMYNVWGFILPYIASGVCSAAQNANGRRDICERQRHLFDIPNRRQSY